MYEEYIRKYLLNKNFDQFLENTHGLDKEKILECVNEEIRGIEHEQDAERSNLGNLDYQQTTWLGERMAGLHNNHIGLIELRRLLNEQIK
jgi:hypothetical protein